MTIIKLRVRVMMPHRNPLLRSRQQVTAVTVEYTSRGKRVRRVFASPSPVGDSRRFYARKLREGRDPRIVDADR